MNSRLTKVRRLLSRSNQEPAPQPDTGDVPLDWFAPEEPVQENPAQEILAQDDPVQEDDTASESNSEPDQDGGSRRDKPTTYQPANLPRDERSEPYEPSDSDAGQAEVSSVPAGFEPPSYSDPSSKRRSPMRQRLSRPHLQPRT